MKFCQTATLWSSNCATSWNFKLRLSAKYYTNSHETNCSNSPIGTAFRRGIIHICKLFHCKAYFDKPQTATLNYIFRYGLLFGSIKLEFTKLIENVVSLTYVISNWDKWLGDWKHLEPMMQQLHSFLLFCYCDDKAIRTTFKPSYISKYMGRAQPNHPGFSMTGPRYALLMYYHSVTMSHLVKQEDWVFVDKLALRDKLNVVVCVLLSYFSSLLFLHRSSVAA